MHVLTEAGVDGILICGKRTLVEADPFDEIEAVISAVKMIVPD